MNNSGIRELINFFASSNNCSIVGAIAYYKLSSIDKYNRFIKWVAKNHITDAKNVGIDEIISIFDKVYDNIPKKVFLARWYPASTDENYERAQHRLNTIKSVPELFIDFQKTS